MSFPAVQWHAYNLIRPNDLLKASAIRRVTTTSATGTTASSRVHMNLQIRVKSLDFDIQSSQLHVSGQIVVETPYTKIGQHHTLDLELQRNFTLEKEVEGSSLPGDGPGTSAGGWDSVAIEMLKDAVDEGGKRRAEAVAVVMQEGLANICFIGQFQTVLKQKVELTIPRKRQGGSDYDKVRIRYNTQFFHTLLTLQHRLYQNSISSPWIIFCGLLNSTAPQALPLLPQPQGVTRLQNLFFSHLQGLLQPDSKNMCNQLPTRPRHL